MLPRIAALILAAGGSTRMGRAKQLLPWRGTTLLRRIAEAALASRATSVAVVVGSEAERARAALDGLPLIVVENAGWREGLGTSLAAGARVLAAGSPPPDAIVVLLADQPLVSAASIDRLIETHATTGSPLVASLHASDPGVPALFASRFFEELQALRGDHGAREILRENAASAAVLHLPEAEIDVDTPSDWEALREERERKETETDPNP